MISFNTYIKDKMSIEVSRNLLIPKLEKEVRNEIMKRMNECFDSARTAFSEKGYDGRFGSHKDWKKCLEQIHQMIPKIYRQIETASREMCDCDDGQTHVADLEMKAIESAKKKIWAMLEEYDKE